MYPKAFLRKLERPFSFPQELESLMPYMLPAVPNPILELAVPEQLGNWPIMPIRALADLESFPRMLKPCFVQLS